MNEEEKDSQSNDHDHPTIISSEDREIKQTKPPNDKIINYKIVEEKNSSNS